MAAADRPSVQVKRRVSLVSAQTREPAVVIVPDVIRQLASDLSHALSPSGLEAYIFLFCLPDGEVRFRVLRGAQRGVLPTIDVPVAVKGHTHLVPSDHDSPFTPPSQTDLTTSIFENLQDNDPKRWSLVFQPDGGLWSYRPTQQLLYELQRLQPDLVEQLRAARGDRLTPQTYVAHNHGPHGFTLELTPETLTRIRQIKSELLDLQLGLRTQAAFFIEEDKDTGEERQVANRAATVPQYIAQTRLLGFDIQYTEPEVQAKVFLTDQQRAAKDAVDHGVLSVDRLILNPDLMPYLIDRMSDPDSLSEPDYV